MMNSLKTKIAIGMSGGVDSSVAALLLKNRGFEVVGITLCLTPDGNEQAVYDAKKVAEVIGIEHRAVDLRKEFSASVIDCFVGEYLKGRTPNPCVVCNRTIKFGAMLDYARKLGADKIATGHYAQIEQSGSRYLLKRVDSRKDQSYFLSMLVQSQLAHAVFPLAGLCKDEIRAIAHSCNLPVADKPDSQEICFVPNNDYASFIKSRTSAELSQGNFIDTEGKVIGKHSGIIHYTIGQRKGLGAFGRPVFVTGIDAKSNTVTLGADGEQYSKGLSASSMNWIAFDEPDGEFRAQVKIRFRAQSAYATVTPQGGGEVRIAFDEPQRSVTPGQTVAIYDGDYVVGGGTIDSAVR